MAGTPYLVDSNVLLRWVKPDDQDYPLVVSAIEVILQRDAVLCYTSQNVAEFVHLIGTGTDSLRKKPTVGLGFLRTSCSCFRMVCRFTGSGARCSSRTTSLEFKFTMHDWWLRCEYTGSDGY